MCMGSCPYLMHVCMPLANALPIAHLYSSPPVHPCCPSRETDPTCLPLLPLPGNCPPPASPCPPFHPEGAPHPLWPLPLPPHLIAYLLPFPSSAPPPLSAPSPPPSLDPCPCPCPCPCPYLPLPLPLTQARALMPIMAELRNFPPSGMTKQSVNQLLYNTRYQDQLPGARRRGAAAEQVGRGRGRGRPQVG